MQISPRKLPINVVRRMFAAFSAWLLACSPALDWRTTPVPGTTLTAFFPCKPDHFSRSIPLAGQAQSVTLTSCNAAGQTFAVLAMDVKQASLAVQGLALLRQSSEKNFGGTGRSLQSRVMPLANSGGQAQVVAAELQRTDGTLLHAQMMFFSHGSWVYQATVMGALPNSEAVDFFFDNLKLSP